MKRNAPISVVLRKGSRERVQVLSLELKRSVSWVIAECVELALAKPENQQRVYDAAYRILSKDPSFRPAQTVLEQGKPKPAPTGPEAQQATQSTEKQSARAQQPIFRLDDLAPTTDLPIRTRGAAPAPTITPDKASHVSPKVDLSPLEDEPTPGDPRPARGLLGGQE
jgi:hypothetical protein